MKNRLLASAAAILAVGSLPFTAGVAGAGAAPKPTIGSISFVSQDA